MSGHHGHPLAMLMAYPNATLLRLTKHGLDPTTVNPPITTRRCGSFLTTRVGLWRPRSGRGEATSEPPTSKRIPFRKAVIASRFQN